MRKLYVVWILIVAAGFTIKQDPAPYNELYRQSLKSFETGEIALLDKIGKADLSTESGVEDVKKEIASSRLRMKAIDIWLRYLEPVVYKRINGPLAVEWENEVFEKFEKPYKRTGAGLSLAEIYLNDGNRDKDSLRRLIQLSLDAINTYKADSITSLLDDPGNFYFCNRLYLLNLAAIYTTGFECPDNENIIPELRAMMAAVKNIYVSYNKTFPKTPLTPAYLQLYDKASAFVSSQSSDFSQFDHFTFIKDYVNPLFAMNQKLIAEYGFVPKSFNDYTLNNTCASIFDKSLFTPQNTKGIYSLVEDEAVLKEIKTVGKLLFYDPILSGNNARSCASCHKPKEYFTDTSATTALHFDGKQRLPRNTPTLVDVVYNHLLMLDGRHISLQAQGKDVMTNPAEMCGKEQEIIEKVLSCKEYKSAFKKFAKYTPEEKGITFEHIVSAITWYYSSYSSYYAPFDEAMNNGSPLDKDAVSGFNLFMGKAQCATCHYVPHFNGVPPPYIGSEFEVLGVPADKGYSKLSDDKGRYQINPADETISAFRTGSIRNAEFTKPYMHNGVFTSLDEVIDFYDSGGGQGKRLSVPNQTLAHDSLKLSVIEKKQLLAFIHSLNEKIIFETPPEKLPLSSDKKLNTRVVGGVY